MSHDDLKDSQVPTLLPSAPPPDRTLSVPVKAFLSLLAAAMVVMTLLRVTGTDPSLADSRVGTPAPDCTLRRLGGGEPASIADYSGTVLVVDFWATTCAPCARSMPLLHRLQERFGDQGVKLLSVNVDGPGPNRLPAVEGWAREHDLDEVFLDNGTCAWDYGAQRIPLVVFVDREGMVRRVFRGFTEYRLLASALTEIVEG